MTDTVIAGALIAGAFCLQTFVLWLYWREGNRQGKVREERENLYQLWSTADRLERAEEKAKTQRSLAETVATFTEDMKRVAAERRAEAEPLPSKEPEK